LGAADATTLPHIEQHTDVRVPQALQEGLAVEAVHADRGHPAHRRPPHATAAPSSSTIRSGSASRVTPSIVVGGSAPAATRSPCSYGSARRGGRNWSTPCWTSAPRNLTPTAGGASR